VQPTAVQPTNVLTHHPPTNAAREVAELWREYEAQSSPESHLVKDFDKLEMIVQAHEYEQAQGKDLQQFFDSTAGRFRTETGWVGGWLGGWPLITGGGGRRWLLAAHTPRKAGQSPPTPPMVRTHPPFAGKLGRQSWWRGGKRQSSSRDQSYIRFSKLNLYMITTH